MVEPPSKPSAPAAIGSYQGLLLQPTYRVNDGRTLLQLFGRLEDGPAFLVEEDRFRPYFFVHESDTGLLSGMPNVTVEDSGLRDLDGNPVARVVVPVPGAVPACRERLDRAGARALEADIRFPYRFLIDHDIRAGLTIEGTAEELRPGLLRFRNPRLTPARCRPRLRVLSIDFETTPDASRILSLALAGEGVEEVHLVAGTPVAGARIHADEAGLLVTAAQRIRELDPDVLVGWNVVDFDLHVWAQRASALHVGAELGRIDGPLGFQQDRSFQRQTRAVIPGRMVLDGIPLVRDALRLEDYRLETVARAVLGRGKLIDAEAPDAAAEISRLYREEPEALVAYNLEDARLVLEILEREGLLELTLERSLLSGMPLDRVGASIASFDRLYLPALRRHGVVAPSVDLERRTELVRGGAVLDSQPGIFSNVAVFDFKSLYPSLIRTFHLDPLAHARPGDDPIVAPNGARFSRGETILPGVLEKFMESRQRARQRGDRHGDQALKIMMNALFGVLGAAACRFFDPEIANAITGFGQQTLAWTREAFEQEGAAVLYGDTDSLFVVLTSTGTGEPAQREAEALREAVATRVAVRIHETYRVEPKLELELETVFERLFMPRVRGGSSGSKKRYAGWTDGRLVIIGLEAVRRDWPHIARRLQKGMLQRLFSDREVMPFVRELTESVLAGECDAELVYAKRIRKGGLDRYTATTPPHIQAARKAGAAAGRVIRYVITQGGPEPVLPGRPLPGGIDRRHAVERVLRPVAESILIELGHDFDEALGQPSQLRLF